MMRELARLLLGLTLLSGCQQAAGEGGRAEGKRKAVQLKVVERVFSKTGFGDGWHDYGWAPRDLGPGHPAQLNLAGKGGWIIAHPGFKGRFGGLVFRYKAPPSFGDFLEVRIDSTGSDVFPRVQVRPEQRADTPDGWTEVWLPMQELNPNVAAFDRLVLRAYRNVGADLVEVDDIGFTEYSLGDAQAHRQYTSLRDASMRVDCMAPAKPIHPDIYGIGYDPRLDGHDLHQWQLGATARRWGGNASSRYNWELGHAWNTASDWYFRNVNYTDNANFSYRNFLDDDLTHKVDTALTVPIMGWVAKDTESWSFPVSVFGPQRSVDPTHKDAGDGYTKDGQPLPPGAATRTSLAASPSMMGRWVAAIRAEDAKRHTRSVQMYMLDNEPTLWNSTHRDVHPQPMGYDELLERTLAFGAEVRQADKDGRIAGPGMWGWPAYFYSAIDSAAGFTLHPDRRAHDNVPILAWYLRKLKEHEDKTGERLLDLLDVHFYPQGKGLNIGTGGATDPDTNARRIRSTRSLWDPRYVDESWIGEAIELIPRLRRLIEENYPGRGVVLGEYNFGAEEHITGGLALAEALGRFGQQGLDAAYYWTYPAKDSHAFWAFRAYRNYDGHGAHFGDFSLPADAAPGTSLFASRDEAGTRVVLVALNLDSSAAFRAHIDVSTCGGVAAQRVFTDTAEAAGLFDAPAGAMENGSVVTVMPPYSLSVIELTLKKRGGPLP
jgi:hypothetical protein